MYTPEPSTTERQSPRRRALFGKLAAVGLTGLLVGSAVAVGSMASADEPTTTDQEQVAEPAPTDVEPGDEVTIDDGWAAVSELLEYTPEDEAVWERFDDCLTENGVPPVEEAEPAEPGEDAPEPAAIDIDEAAIDACEEILDDLSGDGFIEFGEDAPEPAELDDIELSPEDEAVLDRYDDCLVENGVPMFDEADESAFEDMTDADIEAFERAYEEAADACEPILDELTDDVMDGGLVEGCDLDELDELDVETEAAPADA